MPRSSPDPDLWKNIAPALEEMDESTLRGLVHDLYKLAPENRAFLAAWIGDEEALDQLLDGYKNQITAQFFTRAKPRLKGGCDLALCRRLVKEYRRITTAREMAEGFDVRGTMDLALHYLEVGTNYVNQIGWDEARPYDSMGAVANELTELCREKRGRKWAKTFLPRVRAVAQAGRQIGYGYGDDLAEMAATFDEVVAASPPRRSR